MSSSSPLTEAPPLPLPDPPAFLFRTPQSALRISTMKTPATTPPASDPSAVRTPQSALPSFDEGRAAHVTPYRFELLVEGKKHPGHGRTVGFHQPSSESGKTDLFGFTRQHVATLPDAEAAALFIEPDPKTDAHARHRATLREHAEAAKAAAVPPTPAPAAAPAEASAKAG